MIAFSDAAHTYKHTPSGIYYGSVSGLISQYKQEFDEAYWAIYTAIRLQKKMEKKDFSRYLMNTHKFDFGAPKMIQVLYQIAKAEGMLQEVIKNTPNVKDEWHQIKDDACAKGTAFHLAKEEQAYSQGHMRTNPNDYNNTVTKIVDSKAVPVVKPTTGPQGNKPQNTVHIEVPDLKYSAKNLMDLPDGYYPELIIWNDKYRTCGTADKVWINTQGNVRFVDIDDWKTNKEIKMPNRYMMKAPLAHLSDVNYIHYTLQISTYAWMLQQWGFHVRNLYLTHQRSLTEEPVRYRLKYLTKEVELMLTHKK